MGKNEESTQHAIDWQVIDALIAQKEICKGLDPDTPRRIFDRLEVRLLLRSHRHGDLRYWTVSHKLAGRLKLNRRRAEPLSRTGLLDAYGRIYARWLPGVHTCYTPAQVEKHFAFAAGPGLSTRGYYLDDSIPDRPRLGVVLVDHAQPAKKLVAKCNHAVARRLDVPAFRRLIESGGFCLLLLTATEGKRKQLEEFFGEGKKPTYVQVRFGMVPELQQILFAKE